MLSPIMTNEGTGMSTARIMGDRAEPGDGLRIDHLTDDTADIDTIAQWLHTEFGHLGPNVTLAQRRERLRACLEGDSLPLMLVARSAAGELMGVAGLQAATVVCPHLTPWLSTVVVAPAFRGRGLASALSMRVVAEAARRGFDTLYLFTPNQQSLYARLGWSVMARTEGPQGVSVVVMSRPTC